jgi:histidinol dehydrogenase
VSELKVQQLNASDAGFEKDFNALLNRSQEEDQAISEVVRNIINDVRARGDAAVIEYTNRFDRKNINPNNAAAFEISKKQIQAAKAKLAKDQIEALQFAATRVRKYHEKQITESWQYTEDDGTVLGQQVTALERVGLYVPGGTAAYPSSVLMNAIPARAAGVDELIMVVPTPDDVVNDIVLAAADIAGVDRVFAIGGAQAIAALAYGTETIPRVDKIVGPGNIYVATAKRLVFGQVDIDMIAGPSEIVVVCDGKTDADWIAMDLFSQAEHDPLAQSILISTDEAFLDKVKASMAKLIVSLPRADIIRQSLANKGALIVVANMDEAIQLVNRIAPEHLELSVDDAEELAKQVRHAGAIFMGRYTAEALGDYCAGPNHVLPTSGTARFSSPLGVYDFQKRTSLIGCSEKGADVLGKVASTLAEGEGLDAHAKSAAYRVK